MGVKRTVSVSIAAAAVLTLVVFAAAASATRYVAGSEGSGDPFFPLAGNGGYDVRHYSLRIASDQPANLLQASRSSGRAPRRA